MCMYSNLRHCSKTIKGNNFAYSLRKFVDISLHSITLIRYCLLICNVTNHNSLKSVEMNSNKIKEEDATSENFLIKNYKGLIFDCDGTLVNSMEYYYNGWIPLYQKHELKFSRERFYSLAGVPVRRIIEIVLEENNKTVEANFVDSILEEKKLINSKRRANGEAPTEITCVTNIVKELYGNADGSFHSPNKNASITFYASFFNISFKYIILFFHSVLEYKLCFKNMLHMLSRTKILYIENQFL